MNTAIGHPKSYHTYKSDDELLLSRHNWGLYYPKWLAIRIIGGDYTGKFLLFKGLEIVFSARH